MARGQMVEIGGSFRIPEVMEASGCHLKEVGTTNKVYLQDYENAIGEDTALLLKVHTSNYRICGFTETVPAAELVSLGQKYRLPTLEDLGSGVLVDLSQIGIEKEPTVPDSVAAGVDVVTFSGDKLLGGPQAGIIVGKKEYLDRIKRHPGAGGAGRKDDFNGVRSYVTAIFRSGTTLGTGPYVSSATPR